MTTKLNLGIFFGGRSCEHEVSVASARAVLKAIAPDKYRISLIGIDKSGHWHLATDLPALVDARMVRAQPTNSTIAVDMQLHHQGNLTRAQPAAANAALPALDVALPLVHGSFGEDGTLQGVFEMAGLPYVGCGVAASALAMDKALAKKLFQAADLPQTDYQVLHYAHWQQAATDCRARVEHALDYPMFVKPANLGSSVGISKATTRAELCQAIKTAFLYDTKILVEQGVENNHEVECAILGNLTPQASVVGEIIPGGEFYDYQTKYLDDKSELLIPTALDSATQQEVQRLAIAAFQAIDARGLARVDFFVDKTSKRILLNEINTLPGFTPISMYPQLWAASGVAYRDLLDQLIQLALENHRSRVSLKRAF